MQLQNITKHITEVKYRLIYLGFSLFCTFLTCYYFQIEFLYLLIKPFLELNHTFLSTDVTEILTSLISLCFLMSCILLIPFLCYHIWCYLKPGRYYWEMKLQTRFLLFFLLLLCFEFLGIYWYILPEISAFFTSYQIVIHKDTLDSGFHLKELPDFLKIVEISPKLETILHYNLQLFVVFFFLLQIPVFFIICYHFKLVTAMQLGKSRKFIFFLSLLFSAFISPPDVFNQSICTLFFLFLFEMCIFVGYFIESIQKYKNIE